MVGNPRNSFFFFFFLFLVLVHLDPSVSSDDAKALLAIKTMVDASNTLPWRKEDAANICNWNGVRQCSFNSNRVLKLVVELANLTGTFPDGSLTPFDQLRVLSFKSNALSGPIPDISSLTNLKALFLNDNLFAGPIPPEISSLHRLKIVVLSNNLLSGSIPPEIGRLTKLRVFLVQDNRLSGEIPAINQTGLEYFNVSNNNLSGKIPMNRVISQFNASSFLNNPNLCGELVHLSCRRVSIYPSLTPTVSPLSSDIDVDAGSSPSNSFSSNKRHKKRVAAIVGGSVVSFLFLAICLVTVACCFLSSQSHKATPAIQTRSNGEANATSAGPKTETPGGSARGVAEVPSGSLGSSGKRGFSWEAEGLGKLVFCSGVGEMYSLEDLLKASAETLGRGTVGSTYKAVMESGFIVTVKRLKDSRCPGHEEFLRRMEVLGRLRHPNLVPVRAYFQAKEERLLVYDYFPNGSLFSLIHGSRPSGGGKPLHWTSCLKIAEDVATGLLYLHQTPGMIHGNLKSSNVLLGSDFESSLTDYGLVPTFKSPDSSDDSNGGTGGAAALFYRAPEARNPPTNFTQQSDVYCFGVLLLELLTGKTPFQDLVEKHGENIPDWVRSVREEETESSDEPLSGNETSEEKLGALLNVAMACVAIMPENRPATNDVLKMIREDRADVIVSSGGSDHSPARWSDTVQSLPREYGSGHSNLAERD